MEHRNIRGNYLATADHGVADSLVFISLSIIGGRATTKKLTEAIKRELMACAKY